MMQPAVAIILPVYNGREFLRQAIESVLSQDYAAWRLIVINDGSSDDSGEIAREFAAVDKRIMVVDTPNGGLSVARNRGLELIEDAEFVTFLDADDELLAGAISGMVALAVSAPDVDMVVGGFTLTEDAPNESKRDYTERVMNPVELISETLYQRGAVHAAWGKLLRRTIFEREIFTPGLYYEDLDFFYRACLCCRLCVVTDRPVYYYRQHRGSIMHTWSERRLDVLQVTADIERYMAINLPQLLPAARDRRLSANFNIFIEASRNCRPDIAAQCWNLIRNYRFASLRNRRVRFKNRAGAALSYFGPRIFLRFAKWAGM